MILRLFHLNETTSSIEEACGAPLLTALAPLKKFGIHLGKSSYTIQCFRTDSYTQGDKAFGKIASQGNLWGKNKVEQYRISHPQIADGFYISALNLWRWERQKFWADVEKYLR